MKWIMGLSLAFLLGGCGSSTTGAGVAPMGEVSVAVQEPGTNTLGVLSADDTVVLKDNNGTGEEIARLVLSRDIVLADAEGNNKCKCKERTPCTPCKYQISRSCGSMINTTEKLAEAQPADDTKMALLSATYDISVNRDVVPTDTLSSGIKVALKIPKCIYSTICNKYYDFKDGEVYGIKVWIQPVNSSIAGYWVTPDPVIVDGEITFTVKTPCSHMALFGIVDKCISGGA